MSSVYNHVMLAGEQNSKFKMKEKVFRVHNNPICSILRLQGSPKPNAKLFTAQLAPNYFLTHVDRGAKRIVKLCCRDDAINCLFADYGHCGLGPIYLQQKYQFSSATEVLPERYSIFQSSELGKKGKKKPWWNFSATLCNTD